MLEQMYNFYPKNKGQDRTRSPLHQFLRIMKLTTFILIAVILHVSATSLAQKVTLVEKNAPLAEVFDKISTQTGYDFLFTSSDLKNAKPVTINIKNEELKDALQTIFANQPLDFSIEDKSVVIKGKQTSLIDQLKSKLKAELAQVTVQGKVQDELGQPLAGVTITVKGTERATATNKTGAFELTVPDENTAVVFTYIGYEPQELRAKDIITGGIIILKASTTNLHEVVINKGFYRERQETLTGDVSKINAKEIEQQPVTNVLGALEGRVPGLVISQASGQPGSGFSVRIRGQNSILNGSNPLYVIDGVPYISTIPSPYPASIGTNQITGLVAGNLAGGNALNYLSPENIESVEILKDADATAIYGSRAANGAILITTKKGKAGAMQIDAKFEDGISQPSRTIKTMNTSEYLALRRQAYKNSGVTIPSYAYDLTFWDTTRYTNFPKLLAQNISAFTNAALSISGGNTNTQYAISGNYNHQSDGFYKLLPNNGNSQQSSVHLSLNSSTEDKKFSVSTAINYTSDNNTTQPSLPFFVIYQAPDAPPLFNSDGSLNWAPVGPGQSGTWTNPLSFLYQQYQAKTENLVSNVTLTYHPLESFSIKADAGLTNLQIDEASISPIAVQDPGYQVTSGYATYGETTSHSWQAETQADYHTKIGKGNLSALLGVSFNVLNNNAVQYFGTGYGNDGLLFDPHSASNIYTNSSYSTQYKYTAFRSRVNYNLEDKYILNVTATRDGSSRFGPGKQFGNFWSVGGAWLFYKEHLIQDALPLLSFGKLRASYGTSGNDQIPDYQFLNTYAAAYNPYGSAGTLAPQTLFNPDLAWELDRKLEGGIELGFLKDRINLQVSYFRNRSNNQLVAAPVSAVTGFATITENLPALVQNSGWEALLNTVNLKTKDFSWSTNFNFTLPQNKLLSFPGLALSPYSQRFVIGQPITIQRVYHEVGVNSATGAYQFLDSKGNLTYQPNYQTDLNTIINTAPSMYGGFENTFTYKGLSFNLLFQFVRQTGYSGNLVFNPNNYPIGSQIADLPTSFLDYWKKPGDITKYQMPTAGGSGPAATAANSVGNSDFNYTNASFIRLKNVALSWLVPGDWKTKAHIRSCRLFINGQNLLTITKYDGVDPETQNGFPSKRVLVAGVQLTL